MSKTIKNKEPRFTGDWEPTVEVMSRGPSSSTMKRKVVAKSKVYINVNLDRLRQRARGTRPCLPAATQRGGG